MGWDVMGCYSYSTGYVPILYYYPLGLVTCTSATLACLLGLPDT